MSTIATVIVNGFQWHSDNLLKVFERLDDEANFDMLLPLTHKEICFCEDHWDFSELDTLNRSKSALIYDFSKLNPIIKNAANLVIFKSIVVKKNSMDVVSSQRYQINYISDFINEESIYHARYITLDTILNFKNSYDPTWHETTRNVYNTTFIKVLTQITAFNPELDYREHCKELKKVNNSLLAAEMQAGKTPAIPRPYFNQNLKGNGNH